jgi:hypothetical protein
MVCWLARDLSEEWMGGRAKREMDREKERERERERERGEGKRIAIRRDKEGGYTEKERKTVFWPN